MSDSEFPDAPVTRGSQVISISQLYIEALIRR
jgi:hypothetical protein